MFMLRIKSIVFLSFFSFLFLSQSCYALLIEVVKEGNPAQVKQLLEQGVDVNETISGLFLCTMRCKGTALILSHYFSGMVPIL